MAEMSKTPEEIKKGLECCISDMICEGNCAYDEPGCIDIHCKYMLQKDALALIQRLERDKAWASENYDLIREENKRLEAQNAELLEKIKQLERERDALIEDLRTKRHICDSCKHKPGYGYGCTSVSKIDGTCWEWRGPCEENGGSDA